MLWHVDGNGIIDEPVKALHNEDGLPLWHPDYVANVHDDGGLAGVKRGWRWVANRFEPLPTATYSQADLYHYGNDVVVLKLSTTRPYVISGAGGPIVEDYADTTAESIQHLYMTKDIRSYPTYISDENYQVFGLTQAQLTEFCEAVFAYADSVWDFYNLTVLPGINDGSIKTPADIDALPWPT